MHPSSRRAHEFEEFLGDVQYPADKRALAESARRNQAPEEVRRRLERLPDQTFPDMREVRRAWTGQDGVEQVGQKRAGAAQTSSRPTGTRHG